MSIPAGVIFLWTGANADIPANWERVTDLDAKFVKATAEGVDPAVEDGNATHTHTSPSHTHSMDNHVHVINIAAASGGSTDNCTATGLGARATHDHTNFNSGNPSNVNVGGTAATYGACSNDPPYNKVIFITPSITVGGLPNLALCFSGSNDLLGFNFCDGSSSTPDLRNKYLKGAAAGDDGGGTGGSYTNTHDLTHAHVQSHTHASAVSGGATSTGKVAGGSGRIASAHTHSIALPVNSTATGDTVVSLVTTETVEPSYYKLVILQNRTGNARQVKGMIGMWLGTLEDIPSGWVEVTELRGYFIKCANSADEFGNTGGSNTHTHDVQSHRHSNIDHGHTYSTTLNHVSAYQADGSGVTLDSSSATHNGATITNSNYTLANADTSANSSNNEPEYVTVAFIRLEKTGGATFLQNFI